ncbi:QueT transporter family protein [Caldicellulosiruptor naganoensis]|uniref:QueT transporter family protein n=1 Tax=Caldicellulosiruptor naganoensis TaxID=29324 RepID=A0ABY7BEH5_9FIRM|nr:QueT transporter family protein [Caldicellulosiruptor naganoensis]WAM30491.1 QueT transporter family protein [Caldicellulosiruptor naganoensis]
MKKLNLQVIARSGLIAALYFVLTSFLPAISYGPIQVRISEALTLLPALMPVSATVGLFIGCFLANLYGMMINITGIYDVIFGSLATLVAAIITTKIRKKILLPLPTIIVNAVVVSSYIWYYFIDSLKIEWLKHLNPVLRYLFTMLSIGTGEAIATYVLGLPLFVAIEKQLKGKRLM